MCISVTGAPLTHWSRVTHIYVSKLTIIGSHNGLSPGRCQAIIWTNAGILLIEPLGTNFTEILIEIHTFPFKKIHLKMSSAKWRIFGLGLNELIISFWHRHPYDTHIYVGEMVHYTIPVSFLCRLIWRHWTCQMIVRYILSSVCLRLSQFSQLYFMQ